MKNNFTNVQRFVPKKKLIFPFTIIALQASLLLVIRAFREHTTIEAIDLVALGIWALVISYTVWQWFGTYYEIRNGQLYYRSGFTRGGIPVSSIRKIETHTRSWASTNAALANKGMMITYHKWDELFLAPKDENAFLDALLKINPEIQIKTPDSAPERFAA